MSVPCEQIPKFQCHIVNQYNQMHFGIPLQCFFDVPQQTITVSKAVFIHNTVGDDKDVEMSQASLGRLVKENDLCPVFFGLRDIFLKQERCIHQQLLYSTTFFFLPCFLGIIYSV